ncbi:MAG: hypothetical protein QW757_00230 [Candidatus Woesearchaeota archaeon]
MNKLVGIIDSLDYYELKLIQKDLLEGNLAKLINARIKEFENKKENFCPILAVQKKKLCLMKLIA